MSARREIEFPWEGGATILSRPTLAKLSQVEAKLGPALVLHRRIGSGEASTTRELLPLLAIVLRGCDGAPAKEEEIIEKAWIMGTVVFQVPLINWLTAGHMVDTPADPDAKSGN
jgi:hypothetical protein